MALAELSPDELEAEIATFAAHLAAGMCRWLELVAEADRRGNWAGVGQGSCAEWLAWRCGLSPRSAREHVRVARALGDLPLTHAAFARGEVSYAKVRALTRVATPDTEAAFLDLAAYMTAGQLERTVAAYRRVTTREARNLQEDAQINVWWDADGSLVVHGRLAPEDGALLLRALYAAKDGLGDRTTDRGSAEPRRRATNAEALVAIADVSLAGGTARTGGDRYQVVVHVDDGALAAEEGGASLDDGPAIAAETARRLAYDASVVRISERNGRSVRLGRKTRTIPPALRRALHARDRRCRFPGCENRLWLHGHHVRHWAHGGETNLDNLVLLCSRHHRLVHEGGYHVDEQLRFYDQFGRRIPAAPRPARGDPDELLAPDGSSEIGPRTYRLAWYDPLDLAASVDHMLHIARAA